MSAAESREHAKRIETPLLLFVAAGACVITLAIVIVTLIRGGSGDRLAVGDPIPAVTLRDENDRVFPLSALAGRRYALTFVNTRCDDPLLCPASSAMFARAQDRIGEARLIEATLDPAYDTPATLAAYGRRFALDTTRVRLLSGADGVALAQRFGVEMRHTPQGLAHTERLVIVDADGRIERIVEGDAWIPDDLVAMLRRPESVLSRIGATARESLVWCGAHGTHGAALDPALALGLLPIVTIVLVIGFARAQRWFDRRRPAA
jgi:cytochrome oxidase Cu insertion factor (SCO1/SenC/PrrC family)